METGRGQEAEMDAAAIQQYERESSSKLTVDVGNQFIITYSSSSGKTPLRDMPMLLEEMENN